MTIDLNNLSDEVLLYSNDRFYGFLEESLGVDEMMLIKMQSIKNIRTLINVPDLLAFLSFNSKEIAELKNRICFIDEGNDKNFIVKAGIKTNIDDLILALKEKNKKHTKRTKSSKSSSSLTLQLTNEQSNTSASDMSSSYFTDSQLTTALPAASKVTSANHYIQSISDSIERFSLNTFTNIILANNIDYMICLTELDPDINGYIKCGCNATIKIGYRSKSNSFQLSAYLKHLKNSRCRMVKKKKQELNTTSEVTNKLSYPILQDDDQSNKNDINDFDEENLTDENNSSHTTIISDSTVTGLHFSREKRSLSSRSASSTRKKIRPLS